MSGGSLNYLFQKDGADIMNSENREFLDKAIEALLNHGRGGTAARIGLIAMKHDQLAEEIEKYRDVLHAVEWVLSGDWSEEDLKNAVFNMPYHKHKGV